MQPDPIQQLKSTFDNSPNFGDADRISFTRDRSPQLSQSPVPVPSSTNGLATAAMWFLTLGTLASGLVLTVQMGLGAIANHQAAKDLEIKEAQLAQVREARTICGTFPGVN